MTSFKGSETYFELKKNLRGMVSRHERPSEIFAVIDKAYFSGALTLEEMQYLYVYLDGVIDGAIIEVLSTLTSLE